LAGRHPRSEAGSILTTLVFTLFALAAFAANSVLSRLALGAGAIDAASYTVIRLFSGILVLAMVLLLSKKRAANRTGGSWTSGLALFLYAVTFSFAYTTLDTGTGALILFGAVQVTMILLSMFGGDRLRPAEWLGVLVAFGGFVYLVLPRVTTPSFVGLVLMTAAGVSWGVYTLKGRGSPDPVADTAYNFIRTAPFILVLFLVSLGGARYSAAGIGYAALSGAVTSGLGYTVWYYALRGLNATRAAVVQLSVPVIAALGGVVWVGETISLRLALSGLLILGGILLVILGPR